MSKSERSVFTLLDHIRDKPGMYVGNRSLHELETLVSGYYLALGVHGIDEMVPSMDTHFLTWLSNRTKWACDGGWAVAIEDRQPDRTQALAKFFQFVDEYRQLKPVTLCTAKLGPRHNPTGRRWHLGSGGLMEKPRRIDIVRYRPEALHFLRFHYADKIQKSQILMTATVQYETAVRHAKQWVRDEFQVDFAEWDCSHRRSQRDDSI